VVPEKAMDVVAEKGAEKGVAAADEEAEEEVGMEAAEEVGMVAAEEVGMEAEAHGVRVVVMVEDPAERVVEAEDPAEVRASILLMSRRSRLCKGEETLPRESKRLLEFICGESSLVGY
jgi:hypothetical protein